MLHIIPRHVTRGGGGEVSPALFQKLEKSVLILKKITLIAVIDELNFSFKVQFLRVSRRKNRRFFPVGSLFFVLYMIVYQSALIPRKLSCPKKILVTRLVHELNFLTSVLCTPISSRNQKSQFLVLYFFCFCSSRIYIWKLRLRCGHWN